MNSFPRRNRIATLLTYIQETGGSPFSLAKETGLPRSTLRRIINGSACPDFITVAVIADAFERRIGVRLDPRDIVAFNGEFLTPQLEDLLPEPKKDAVEAASQPSFEHQFV